MLDFRGGSKVKDGLLLGRFYSIEILSRRLSKGSLIPLYTLSGRPNYEYSKMDKEGFIVKKKFKVLHLFANTSVYRGEKII
jgi:hypothetical protein